MKSPVNKVGIIDDDGMRKGSKANDLTDKIKNKIGKKLPALTRKRKYLFSLRRHLLFLANNQAIKVTITPTNKNTS
jgi:hypothetical protein